MRFRVDGMIAADVVSQLSAAAPSLRGKVLIAVAEVGGPVTNHAYAPEEIGPHLDAIREAIASQRVFFVETDSTARTWPHDPDPGGSIDQRILKAIAEERFSDDDPSPR